MSQPDLNRAARMAYRLLLRDGTGALPVDPAAIIRKCRDTELLTWQELSQRTGTPVESLASMSAGADAFILRDLDSERKIIASRNEGNPCRLRFTLAHELGHLTLRHCGAGDFEEREADCFASHLLAPRTVIRACIRRGPVYSEQLQRLFFVSHSMIIRAAHERFALPEGVDTDALETLFAPSIPEELPGGKPGFGWVRVG